MSSRFAGLLGGAFLLVLASCTEAEVTAELRSLQGSEDAVFVCRDAAGNGHAFDACPDLDPSDDALPAGQHSVFALVTQTITDEVAVVDVTRGKVVDTDPSTPGFGFLRVGARPVAIAATPGGVASFVAVADPGRNGIFGLPTTCLDSPAPGDLARDLTTWPACRLDSTPGELTVLVEPPADGVVLDACGSGGPQSDEPAGASRDLACPANLATEEGPKGRRKLVVSLPERGQLAVIDAQWLLDTQAVVDDSSQAFPDCKIEHYVDLKAEVPAGVKQTLPTDLVTSCEEDIVAPPSAHAPRPPQPAGFAVGGEKLYVADGASPVIHVLDATSPCNLNELPPLLPMSLREPERAVTTRKLAVSPPTPSGKRFLYAIDAEDQPGASVMVFDVSADSTDPTPLVRPGSPELPGERPDRLALGSSARDVTFAYRDLPYVDPTTGVGTFGAQCDPTPSQPATAPGVLARPTSDFTGGARPALLRGLFGFILLTNGQISLVDVEDFDAPCRRPKSANASLVEDFRGCAGDPEGVSFFTEGGGKDEARTVTDEVSCRVVAPHRFRSATLASNDPEVGVRAPSLRNFPQLSVPGQAAGSALAARPRLLAVPHVNVAGTESVGAELFVGATAYSTDVGAENALPVDPNDQTSEQAQSLNSLILPPLEPRAYAAEDSVAVTYEGTYAAERPAGFIRAGQTAGSLVVEDVSRSFCGAGVYDVPAMTDYATKELGLSVADAAEFAEVHADYVQIVAPLLAETDTYWRTGLGRDVGYGVCAQKFGPHDADVLAPTRDLRIRRAFADRLEVEPLDYRLDADLTRSRLSSSDKEALARMLDECFPTATSYRLRAGEHWVVTHASRGFNHDVITVGADRACTRSCSPLKKWAKSRVFEISNVRESCSDAPVMPEEAEMASGAVEPRRVGCAAQGDVACVFDQELSPGVQLTEPASACIFSSLTERFAIYRGRASSVRDSAFTWQTTGGFTPLVMSLLNVSSSVSPQSIQFLPQPELMAVVDGSSLGLSLLSLDVFSVVRPSPFY